MGTLGSQSLIACERPLIPAFSPVGEKVAKGRMRGKRFTYPVRKKSF